MNFLLKRNEFAVFSHAHGLDRTVAEMIHVRIQASDGKKHFYFPYQTTSWSRWMELTFNIVMYSLFIHVHLFYFLFYFYLYIYSPESQESAGGAIHRASNYPDLLPEMPRYCCPLEIFIQI